MRIKEEFKKSGYFWLPSFPEKKLPGTLVITDGGNIELEIVGLFDESIEGLNRVLNNNNEFERIVGEIEKHGYVTLDNCFYKSRNISFGGISKSSIHVHSALVGVAYEEKEEVLLNSFQFSVEGIDEWVGLSGIEVEYEFEEKTATINYSPPDEILIELNNGMKLLITFSWSIPAVLKNSREAKIIQKTYFKLISEHERQLNDFTSVAYKITNLLGFAIDKTVCIEQVSVTSNSIQKETGKGKTAPIPILFYYPSLPHTEVEPKIDQHAMLFKFAQIQENASRIINNWFDAYDEIDSALNLYFAAKTGAHKYVDGRFLSLVQGLETYHRRTSDEKIMEEKVFEELTKYLISQCPKENQEWLRGKLKYGNEVNLGKRIKSIIEPFKEFLGTSKERSKLVRTIVNTRNYLTHYDESLKPTIAYGKDLFLLSLRMEAIFQLHLLKMLGFTQIEIKTILEKSRGLQYKLKDA